MPIYTCPRCGGKEGYSKRIHELRADGFSRAPTGPKTQKFRNVDLVITACKSCGEEMTEEFTPSEIEQKNLIAVQETLKSGLLMRRIFRIAGYILIFLAGYVLVVTGSSVVAEDRTDFILPMLFWTLAFGISGILLLLKYRKSLVSVWIVSPGKRATEYQSDLTEFAKNDKQLNTMLGFIDANTPFNASGLITFEEARTYSERLERLGAKILIG